MRKLSKEYTFLYLLWAVEFIFYVIIAFAVCLIATAVIGQVPIGEVIESLVHLIDV